MFHSDCYKRIRGNLLQYRVHALRKTRCVKACLPLNQNMREPQYGYGGNICNMIETIMQGDCKVILSKIDVIIIMDYIQNVGYMLY